MEGTLNKQLNFLNTEDKVEKIKGLVFETEDPLTHLRIIINQRKFHLIIPSNLDIGQAIVELFEKYNVDLNELEIMEIEVESCDGLTLEETNEQD